MELITNPFAVLDMDSYDEDSIRSSRTPTYPPTPLTVVEVEYIKKLDDEMKNSRFRTWKRDEPTVDNLFAGAKEREFPSSFGRQKDELSLSRSNRSGLYQPPHKPRPLNSNSAIDFPSLSAPAKVSTGASKTWGDSFAKKVADLAERERERETKEEQRRIEETEERHCRMSDMQSIPVFSSRFRRTLEDILAEDDTYEDCEYDNAFPDDDYEPSTMNDLYTDE